MQPFDLLCGFMKITFTTRLTELNIQKQRKRQHVTMLCSESNMLPCYAVKVTCCMLCSESNMLPCYAVKVTCYHVIQ